MEEKSIAQMQKELKEFYFKNVKSNLDNINRQRRKNTLYYYATIMILSGFILLAMDLKLPGVAGTITFLLCFGLIGGGFLILSLSGKSSSNSSAKKQVVTVIDLTGEAEIKKDLMGSFLKIFSEDIRWTKSKVPDVRAYKELNIMNPYFFLTFDDTIWGKYRDVNFKIAESDTSLISTRNLYVTLVFIFAFFFIGGGIFLFGMGITFGFAIALAGLFNADIIVGIVMLLYLLGLPLFGLWKLINRVPFRGVFVEFDMNKNFEGHTFLFERGATNRTIKFDRSKFEEVKLEDPEFSSKFIVYSDNQVEARYVLTTAFIERFKNMKTAFSAKYIRAAFKDKKITIAIHAGKDLFAMTDLHKETDSHTFAVMFAEILSVLELIKVLKLNQKIGL